jgi:hypothetical protein
VSVDTLNEAIKLESSKTSLDVSQLSAEISKQKPRYSLFRFSEFDNKPICGCFVLIYLVSLVSNQSSGSVFIYSIPPSQSCTIKELMLFSR